MKLCDLHTHSIFSDGTFTPEETVDLAIQTGLSAVALTDHNSVMGLDRFISYAENKPIDIVPGIEFSTRYNDRDLHILGLFFKPESFAAITEYVKAADELKDQSNIDLAKKLNTQYDDILIFLRPLHQDFTDPLIHMNYEECDAFLPIAKEHGLAGIETTYSLYSDTDTEFAKRMCAKHKLLESGGSDFHGTNKPDIALGKGKGNLEIPYEFYEILREVAK